MHSHQLEHTVEAYDLVLRNCRVLGPLVPGYDGDYADIHVSGKLIAGIEKCDSRHGGESLDMRGATVLPGLLDIHVHLDMSGGDLDEENGRCDVERALLAVGFLRRSLHAGFTTLRDIGARNHVDLALRDAAASGAIEAPSLFVAGRILSPPTEGNGYYPGMYAEAVCPEGIKAAAEGELGSGADYIKYMGGRDITEPDGLEDYALYDESQISAITDVTRRMGTYAAAHCQSPAPIWAALNAGVRTIEHGFILDGGIIEELGRERSFLVPTLRYLDTLRQYPERLPPHLRERIDGYIDETAAWLNKAYRAGLRMGFGTDAGTYGNHHGANAKEAALRVRLAGIDPMEVISQATAYSAAIICADDRGLIAHGKRADIIALAGDPLRDITELERPIFVMQAGKTMFTSLLENH
jgi:imidazolonepropionase-like amidohydrolase